MRVSTIASTKPGFEITVEEAFDFSGKCAGICYMPDTFQAILEEKPEATAKRIKQTLTSKHHSVYGHVNVTLLLEGIPKMLAMILNNESVYTTSEKSARYTMMELEEDAQALYDKWFAIFTEKIVAAYPSLPSVAVEKMAKENARYTTSVFTPTIMAYTVSLQQLNYVRAMMEKFIKSAVSSFEQELALHMREFIELTEAYAEPLLEAGINHRELSLFIRPEEYDLYTEEFANMYTTKYTASFAQVAQAQRHRTLEYFVDTTTTEGYYIPELLADDLALASEWVSDLIAGTAEFPQAMLVRVVEQGSVARFAMKCLERCCNNAQLEVNHQTRVTLKKLTSEGTKATQLALAKAGISADINMPRCGYAGYVCTGTCALGSAEYGARRV